MTHHVLKRRYEACVRDTARDPICDVTKSCDNHDAIPLCIPVVNMVVALVDVHGARWLTWLPMVCNHDLPVPLLSFVEQSIFQVW